MMSNYTNLNNVTQSSISNNDEDDSKEGIVLFRQTFRRFIQRNCTECYLMSILEKTNTFHSLLEMCKQQPVGQRKEILIQLCDTNPLGVSNTFKQLLDQLQQHQYQQVDKVVPIALPPFQRNGAGRPYIMFYVPHIDIAKTSAAERTATVTHYTSSKISCGVQWDSGMYIVPQQRFNQLLNHYHCGSSSIPNNNNNNQHQISIHSNKDAIFYPQFLESLFELHYDGDIESRPIRIGQLDRSSEGVWKFFARYNMRSHGALNTVTLNTSYLPSTLCPLQWSYQPEGYQEQQWMRLWKVWYSSNKTQHHHHSHAPHLLSTMMFYSILIPGIQAFHDRAIPAGVEAVYGSWNNLTLLERGTCNQLTNTL